MKQATVLWASAVVAAALLAIVGVVAYARDPGVGTYQLNGLLLLPLLGLVLYGLHRVLPVRVQWIAAVVVAPLGGIAYLIWPNDQWWNYGPLTIAPLLALAVARSERNGEERDGERWPAAGHDGPWGPP
jgi:hypothetical protein